MQVLLPCDNAVMRAAATQRPHKRTEAHESLDKAVE